MASRKTAKKAATRGRKKVTRKKAAPKKKAAAKKTTAARRKTRPKKKTGKTTTAADLRKRAAQAETEVQSESASAAGAAAVSVGGLQIPGVDLENLDLGKVQNTVRDMVEFVEENPVAAAAVALGAGVALTSVFWDRSAAGKNKG